MLRPATLPELQAHYGERYRWLLLLSVMIGTMASIMSSTIVNVAIPDMSHHFALGQERAQWVAANPVFPSDRVKVNQQPERQPTDFEIRQKLGLMNGKNPRDRLDFRYKRAFHNEIAASHTPLVTQSRSFLMRTPPAMARIRTQRADLEKIV